MKTIKKTFKRLGVIALIAGIIWVAVDTHNKAKIINADVVQTVKATVSPSDDFDSFYGRKLDEYKRSEAFKVEYDAEEAKLKAHMDEIAKTRVLSAIITKVEQKAN